jgi:hypothetical protein
MHLADNATQGRNEQRKKEQQQARGREAERLYGELQAALMNENWTVALNLANQIEKLIPDYQDVKNLSRDARRKRYQMWILLLAKIKRLPIWTWGIFLVPLAVWGFGTLLNNYGTASDEIAALSMTGTAQAETLEGTLTVRQTNTITPEPTLSATIPAIETATPSPTLTSLPTVTFTRTPRATSTTKPSPTITPTPTVTPSHVPTQITTPTQIPVIAPAISGSLFQAGRDYLEVCKVQDRSVEYYSCELFSILDADTLELMGDFTNEELKELGLKNFIQQGDCNSPDGRYKFFRPHQTGDFIKQELDPTGNVISEIYWDTGVNQDSAWIQCGAGHILVVAWPNHYLSTYNGSWPPLDSIVERSYLKYISD